MKPIRLRLTLLVTSVVVAGSVAGFMAISTHSEINRDNQRIRQSYMLRDWVNSLPHQSARDEIIKELQAYRAELEPIERQNNLSDIIQAFGANNQRLLKKRIDVFESTERRFVAEIEPRITFREQRLIFFSALFLMPLLIFLTLLRTYITKSILDPLEYTKNRMLDFLNGKYSYQFEIPSRDEVGDLQTTFNSMAQRVLQNMEELKDLDSAKSEFLNIASHELRTPMTSIKGSLSLIATGITGEVPKEAKQLVTIAEKETDRLIRLTNDILDMAKIEARKLPMKLQWSPLLEVLKSTESSLLGFADQMKVHLEVLDSPSIEANIDKDRIQQVLTNLASNALKFSPKGSTVKLWYDINENNQITVYVKDEGRGISPDDQKRIFEKFRQATSPDNPLVKGTGLGLAIAKALVEEHNGVIGVQSLPQQGSTFFFTLPKWRRMSQDEHLQDTKTDDNEAQQGVAA